MSSDNLVPLDLGVGTRKGNCKINVWAKIVLLAIDAYTLKNSCINTIWLKQCSVLEVYAWKVYMLSIWCDIECMVKYHKTN